MQFQPELKPAILLRRYKRFLADIETPAGEHLTIHCPNTGAMTGCAEPGFRVWYSTSVSPKRKYPHTWELSETTDGEFIVVNTQRANEVARSAVARRLIPSFAGYRECLREVRYGQERSRIDLLLRGHPVSADCYVEVKSVTLARAQQGYFPDAVTLRGQKHLRELITMVEAGHRAAILFVVGHTGIQSVKPAQHIDPAYAKLCMIAKHVGVEFLGLSMSITPHGWSAGSLLQVSVDAMSETMPTE